MAKETVWFIDLDDTLYSASGGMLTKIHHLMDEYIVSNLAMDAEQASALRTRYWAEYGATFVGLWKHHRIDPIKFLTQTHAFDPSPYIRADGKPAEDLQQLRGRKVIFTNGPRPYAERVVKLLGLEGSFDELVSSFEMRIDGLWCPKPSRQMLLSECRRLQVEPQKATLVDDSLPNLAEMF